MGKLEDAAYESPLTPDVADRMKVLKILMKNKDKNMVKRILDARDYPVLDNGDGSISTHSMAYATDDQDRAMVYPTVAPNAGDAKLRRLGGREAVDRALLTDDYIKFDTGAEADWFSRNYKRLNPSMTRVRGGGNSGGFGDELRGRERRRGNAIDIQGIKPPPKPYGLKY